QITQFVEQIGTEARALDGLEKLLGYDQVGINVLAVQRRYQAMMGRKCLHDGFLSKISYVNKMTRDRSRRRHGGADQMRTPALPLPAFEVAIRRGCAAFSRFEAIGIHGQAHRAT